MLIRTAILLSCFIFCSCFAQAQSSRGNIPPPSSSVTPSDPQSNIGSPVDEMRARWEIKYEEKEQQENVERAREAAQLSTEMHNTFARTQIFGSTEKKKLDRLEKVTRKIRSRAGGSDGDVIIENMPNGLELLLKRLAESAEQLRKAVEDTPRQVVSASVIERANEILELIRYTRSFTR